MSIEGRTEWTAKEDPTKPGRACPYHAERILPERYEVPDAKWLCGECGWLCDMCREDKADARTDRLVEGMALAGVLVGSRADSNRIQEARQLAATLCEREGGEGS